MRLFMHHQGPFPDSQHCFGVIPVKGYYAGFVNYDLVVVNDQGISCPQIHGNLLRQEIE
jgi:hypothetical protein